MDFSIFVLIVFAIAVVLSFVHKDKVSGSVLKILPYFLLFDILFDITALTLSRTGHYNVWLINLGLNIEKLFIFYVYYHLIQNKNYKKFILWSAAAYELFFIFHYINSGNWNAYQIIPSYIGQLLVIITLMLFLLEMLESDSILFLHKYVVFWITIAFLFYNIIPFPIQIGFLLFPQNVDRKMAKFVMIIQNTGNLMMYVSLIIGFLWSSMKYRS
jgi:hypothetical protein